MTYIIDILTQEKKKHSFRIDAKNEEEAKERLMLRLPPNKRENVEIVSIKLDMSTVNMHDPYGTFGEE